MSEKKENYKFRIKETLDGFTVERAFESKEEVPTRWLEKKRSYSISRFYDISVTGEIYLFSLTDEPLLKMFRLKTEAEQWINDFLKYPIYHDFNN